MWIAYARDEQAAATLTRKMLDLRAGPIVWAPFGVDGWAVWIEVQERTGGQDG